MIDWEQLERELADGESDVALGSAAARRRERRQLLVVAGLAVVLLAALVVPLCVVVFLGGAGGTERGGTEGSGRSGGRVGNAALHGELPPGEVRGPAAATRAAVYAAVIAGNARLPLDHPVSVGSRVCATVPEPPTGNGCTGRQIPAAVQQRVRSLLGTAVTFAADPPLPRRASGVTVVYLGPLIVTGNRARVGVDMVCGALCGQGETVLLHRDHGRWHVTGTAGPRWVS